MPSLDESLAGSQSALAAALAAGVDALTGGTSVTFTKYLRLVLPLDGYVFWVRADLVSGEMLQNLSQVGPVPVNAQPTFDALGSVHYATDRRQMEDETLAVNRVVFTARQEVQPFSEISPVVMFVGAWEGLRFAFSQRRSYFRQSGAHHYVGDAVYPALAAQLIETAAALNLTKPVVSNSLPVWLGLNQLFPVFPSFLVPDNLQPPYAVAHVVPDSTRALQPVPYVDADGSHWQLAAERVRITIYGSRNDAALDFHDLVNRFSLDTEIIGIMNAPIIRDEKRTQVELAAIAMKKSIEFEVSYYQTRINDLAQQLITKALATFIIT